MSKPIKKSSFHSAIVPVWEHSGGEVRQYFWNGSRLKAVEAPELFEGDCRTNIRPPWTDSFARKARRAVKSVKNGFIPCDVGPTYWSYVQWKFFQRAVSSLLHVQATQSMLLAVGVGRNALPAAAGLSWVLKDGLGRLGRLLYVATYGSSFDCHLKKVRYWTSFLFTLSMGIETITPLAPKLFLPMAAMANVGKSIGFAAYLATTPAVHKAFVTADNMADISAKGQAQTVLADNVGLVLAMGIGSLGKRFSLHTSLPLLLYPPLAALDMWAVEREIRSVPLKSLNKERLELVTRWWILERRIPTAAEVSQREALLPRQLTEERRKLKVIIGPLGSQTSSPEQMLQLFRSHQQGHFILGFKAPSGRQRGSATEIVLSLRNGAKMEDIVCGMLQACYIQLALGSATSEANRRVDGAGKLGRGHDDVLSFTRAKAEEETSFFMKELSGSEWHTHRVLLSPQERKFYSFDEADKGKSL